MELKPTASLVDVCILSALFRGDAYDAALAAMLEPVTHTSLQEVLQTLSRLQNHGFLESYEWPEDGETRQYYHMTDLGCCRLDRDLREWEVYKRRVDRFLWPTTER